MLWGFQGGGGVGSFCCWGGTRRTALWSPYAFSGNVCKVTDLCLLPHLKYVQDGETCEMLAAMK